MRENDRYGDRSRFHCICNLYIFFVMSMYSYCMFTYLHCASWHTSATLTEVSLCFFLSCKTNARVKLTKTGQGQYSPRFIYGVLFIICVVLLLIVLFYVLFACKCVLYYYHRVSTHLQFTNISMTSKQPHLVSHLSHGLCGGNFKNQNTVYVSPSTLFSQIHKRLLPVRDT
jgi:hypothetical protein